MKAQTLWLQHVEAWRASGLTQADYCRQHGLSVKSLSYWIRRKQPEASATAVKMIPVQVKPDDAVPDTDTPISLLFQGIELELSPAVSPRWLAELLRCLV